MNYNYVNGIEVLLRTVSEYHTQKNKDNDIQQKELRIDNTSILPTLKHNLKVA
jgi:hypothetical protein